MLCCVKEGRSHLQKSFPSHQMQTSESSCHFVCVKAAQELQQNAYAQFVVSGSNETRKHKLFLY